jgi:hypothetical protein
MIVIGHHHSFKIFPVLLEGGALNVRDIGDVNAGRYISQHFIKHE